ncbi:hypothetical protein BAE44_0018439, partial [Dichanthelium oligosanthes]
GIYVHPRFEPSPSTIALDARHFSLDFVAGDDKSSWTVKDSSGSLLLLYRKDCKKRRQDLIVCEPLARCHEVIPLLRSGSSTGSRYWSATTVLLDGGSDSEGGGISGMSNFRVLCVVEDDRNHACMFTSGSSLLARSEHRQAAGAALL